MKSAVKITLPKLGESILSATVVQWFKKVGDPVALDEPLLEVSTDKVNSEIPSPAAGVLEEILAQEGQELQVGEPLATLSSANESPIETAPAASVSSSNSFASGMQDFFSPSVLRLLQENGINLEQARNIPRTGEGGRLTKKDIEQYLSQSTSKQASSMTAPCQLQHPCRPPELVSDYGTERIKMSPMRKAIAENMVRSFYQAPHASLATEVDVTWMMKKIQKEKHLFLEKHGAKLTVTSFAALAIARALHAYPLLNASLEGDTIVMKRFINLGIAVSVDQGVMVPVIRGCERLSLPQVSRQIADLAEKTREHRLQPVDTQEGTITLTNFGMTGTMIGVPIIRYPEVAIVGLGAVTKKVVPMSDDSIAIRSIMWVSLTFDHRVLDGIYGCGFLNELKKQLEQEITDL